MIYKRGLTKLSIGFIFVFTLLLIIANSLATTNEISDVESATIKNKNIHSTANADNMKVVSETKNNIKVDWQPILVGLIDKEYNITIENLEDKEKKIDTGALFKAISGEVDTLVPGSIKLSYLTDLTKVVDDYSEVCTDKEVTLSEGEPNQTVKIVTDCIKQNNPKIVSYKGWKEYSINELRDKQKQEVTLKKADENGKLTLAANGKSQLNLKFKTKIVTRPDGTYGNDAEFGLLLDGVFYHPTFNTSYNKRYLVNITANDALDTNYTHNITFAFTGDSSELGSATYTYANISFLACNNIHVFFNGTTELDAWTEGCNSSNFRVYFRNPLNITRNGTLLNSIEIYYDPIGYIYQRPQDWGAIWLPSSDNFAAGLNTSRWIVDNTTADGNSSWYNVSGTDGVIEIRGGTDSGADGCFRSSYTNGVNFSQDNWGMDMLWIRHDGDFSGINNRAYGINDRPCGGSPNAGSGAFVYGNTVSQWDFLFGLRRIFNGAGFDTPTNTDGSTSPGYWTLIHINTSHFPTNRSSLTWNSSHFTEGPENTIDGRKALGVLVREAHDTDVNKKKTRVDFVRVYQLVGSAPTYTVFQENRTTVATEALKVRACTAENRVNNPNSYNDTCEGTYPATCGPNTTNDFLSCNDGNLETQTYRHNKFTGIHIQTFNSSIINCQSIENVILCYRWWTIGGSSTNCSVAIDANGNASYSVINSTCPNMVNATCPEASPTPTLVCTDVTSSENWTCNSFFGPNGTRAVAKTELSAPNPGPSQMLRTDALFFNVSYTST